MNATRYWETDGNQYVPYEVQYQFVSAANWADVEVRLVQDIPQCGSIVDTSNTMGCAPLVTVDDPPDGRILILIQDGFTDDSTVETITHEFGHTLGRDHGDEPTAVMQARANATRLPRLDASNKTNPWDRTNLTYYVDYRNVSSENRSVVEEEISNAFYYMNEGADGTIPSVMSWTETENRSAANVVVVFEPELSCEGNWTNACQNLYGHDVDTDPYLETYTRQEIRVSNELPPAYVDFYVGYSLVVGMSRVTEDERPAIFVNPNYKQARGDWWE